MSKLDSDTQAAIREAFKNAGVDCISLPDRLTEVLTRDCYSKLEVAGQLRKMAVALEVAMNSLCTDVVVGTRDER